MSSMVSHGRRMQYLDQDHDIKEPVYGIWGYGVALI
jgi:hypothetical protein